MFSSKQYKKIAYFVGQEYICSYDAILLLFIFFLQQTKEQWRKSNQRALEADDHGDYNV